MLLLCIAVLICFVPLYACSKKNGSTAEQTQDTERLIEITQCGLRFQAPEEWIPYETTNIVPMASTTTEGDIFAHIQYNYVTNENMEQLNQFSEDVDAKSLMTPFVEIMVIHKDKLNSDQVKEAFSIYDTQKEITTQDDYHYFLLSDYNGDLSFLTETEMEDYTTLKESIPSMKKTISTFPFDDTEVAEAIDKLNRTITFVSSTLEGEEISSQIFGDYDLTVVNFWASYCYPDINETKALQELNDHIKKEYPNVNFIQVVIDTPTEEAEKIALQAKSEANADFTSVMTDEILANWIVQNVKGLPTTVFVNSNAEVIGDQIQGVHDAEFYKLALEKKLEELQKSKKKTETTE